MVKGLDFNPLARFNGAALAFQHDKTVAEAERAEDVRPLMTGRFNHQLTVRIASQAAAGSRDGPVISSAARRANAQAHRLLAGTRQFCQQRLHQLIEGEGGGNRITRQAAEPAVIQFSEGKRFTRLDGQLPEADFAQLFEYLLV
jgi:hypothetical protein